MKAFRLMGLSPILLLFATGNSPSPAVVMADCRSLQSHISSASPHAALVIKLKQGSTCHIETLEILRRKNVTLDGGHSTLIVSGDKTAIHIGESSNNITIYNISIDYDPLPFTQGIIDDISDGYLTFSIMDHYPPVRKNNNRILLYDGCTQGLKVNESTLYFRNFEIDRDGRRGKIPVPAHYSASLRRGDLIAFRPRGNPAIRLDGLSSNIRLKNVSILSSPGMGIMARYLEGDNHVDVRIVPGPPPMGSKEDRLLSVNADGVNFAYTRKGPAIENSYISRQGDDGINLHGLVLGMHAATGPTSAIVLRPFGNDRSVERILRPGDHIRFLAKDDFRVLGSGRIRELGKIDTRPLHQPREIAPLFPRAALDGAKSATFYGISFLEDIPAGTAYLDAVSAASEGFVIRNNTLSQNRGHGIVIGASQGQIVGNTIAGTTHNAIIVGPNFDPWREGSWPGDVSITGNTIIDPCTDGLSDKKLRERSSIFIGSDQAMGTHDVAIYGNRIEACHGQWIKAVKVNRISISDNIFVTGSANTPGFCDRISKMAVAASQDYTLHDNQCEQ